MIWLGILQVAFAMALLLYDDDPQLDYMAFIMALTGTIIILLYIILEVV